MSSVYMTDRRRPDPGPVKEKPAAPGGPDMAALAAGAAPTSEQMGRRVDLPGEIREKMESSFGADFSNVKIYESQAVADAGAQAVTRGGDIAFAPGKLDLVSTSGQAFLGHELSHVVSQARGESAGRGFLNDPGLEAQADRQGMLAARGESVYMGPVSPIGTSSAAASGPMQAKKNEEPEEPLKISDHDPKAVKTKGTLDQLAHDAALPERRQDYADATERLRQQSRREGQSGTRRSFVNMSLETKAFWRHMFGLRGNNTAMKTVNGKQVRDTDAEVDFMRRMLTDMAQSRQSMVGTAKVEYDSARSAKLRAGNSLDALTAIIARNSMSSQGAGGAPEAGGEKKKHKKHHSNGGAATGERKRRRHKKTGQ